QWVAVTVYRRRELVEDAFRHREKAVIATQVVLNDLLTPLLHRVGDSVRSREQRRAEVVVARRQRLDIGLRAVKTRHRERVGHGERARERALAARALTGERMGRIRRHDARVGEVLEVGPSSLVAWAECAELSHRSYDFS